MILLLSRRTIPTGESEERSRVAWAEDQLIPSSEKDSYSRPICVRRSIQTRPSDNSRTTGSIAPSNPCQSGAGAFNSAEDCCHVLPPSSE